jgi:hypothetical protein
MLVIPLVMAVMLAGCWQEHHGTIVVLVDATKSIDPAEYERCRIELNRLMQRLGRGDRLVLVPITGEPEELLGHRIVHVAMPTERVPYDSNLKQARAEAARRIEQFLLELPEIQAKHTDIIGALRAAAEAFDSEGTELICLSDMVEDDAETNFLTAPELAQTLTAEKLAERTARKGLLRGVLVKVGVLKSFDLEKMNPARRDATQAFWRKYFLASGASQVKVAVDLENLSGQSQ